MAAVTIGVDPHKGSHTAVVIDQAEVVLGQVRVRASAAQAQRLLAWAAAWPERTWAVEGARGMGYLLAQQLVAAGERVLDVQPKLGARVRLLATGKTNKNDPSDALSVAIAALRSAAAAQVRPDDHATVLKVWSKRHRDLSRSRNQGVCRLHAVLCDLIPGGVSKQIRAAAAARVLEQARPSGAVQQARHELAAEFLADLCRIDVQPRQTRKKLATAVRASGATVTEVFGAGPAVAATVIGDVRDISRFPRRNNFAACNGTAPVEVPSGNRVIYRLPLRGNRAPEPRHPHGRGHPDPLPAQPWPRLLRQESSRGQDAQGGAAGLKRQISDAICKHLKADAARAASTSCGPGGHPGNGSSASVTGLHPEHRLFGQATPGPVPTLRSRPGTAKAACRAQRGQAPGLPALPAPRGRRGSGVNGRPQAVARSAMQSTLETGGTAP